MRKIEFRFENYAFDLYGTLVDIHTDENRPSFWNKIAKRLDANPCEVKSFYLSFCREQAEKVSPYGEFDLLIVFEKLLKRFGSTESPESLARFFRQASTDYERLYPCVRKWLKRLKKTGKGIYLISNAQSCFTLKELDDLKILRYFDGIVISSEAGVKKPSTEIFEIAFERFKIQKENTLYVGNDLRDDILGAENFGIKSFYVQSKQSGVYPELEYLKSKVLQK